MGKREWTPAQWRILAPELLAEQGGCCGICGEPIDALLRNGGEKLTIDHIDGDKGNRGRANLQAAHHTCNVRKGSEMKAALVVAAKTGGTVAEVYGWCRRKYSTKRSRVCATPCATPGVGPGSFESEGSAASSALRERERERESLNGWRRAGEVCGPVELRRRGLVERFFSEIDRHQGGQPTAMHSRMVRRALLVHLLDELGEFDSVYYDDDFVTGAAMVCGCMEGTVRKHVRILCSPKHGWLVMSGAPDVQSLCWKGEGRE